MTKNHQLSSILLILIVLMSPFVNVVQAAQDTKEAKEDKDEASASASASASDDGSDVISEEEPAEDDEDKEGKDGELPVDEGSESDDESEDDNYSGEEAMERRKEIPSDVSDGELDKDNQFESDVSDVEGKSDQEDQSGSDDDKPDLSLMGEEDDKSWMNAISGMEDIDDVDDDGLDQFDENSYDFAAPKTDFMVLVDKWNDQVVNYNDPGAQGLSKFNGLIRSMNGTTNVCVREDDVELGANARGFSVFSPSFNKLYTKRQMRKLESAFKFGIDAIIICDGNNKLKGAEMHNQILSDFGIEIQTDDLGADAVASSELLDIDNVAVPNAASIKITKQVEKINVTPLLQIGSGEDKKLVGVLVNKEHGMTTTNLAVLGSTAPLYNYGIGNKNNAMFAAKLINHMTYGLEKIAQDKFAKQKEENKEENKEETKDGEKEKAPEAAKEIKQEPVHVWTDDELKKAVESLESGKASSVSEGNTKAGDKWPKEFVKNSFVFADFGSAEPLATYHGFFSTFKDMETVPSNETDMSKLNFANIDYVFWMNPTESISDADEQALLSAKHLVLAASQNSMKSDKDHPINGVASKVGVRFMPGAVVSHPDRNTVIKTTGSIQNGNKTTTARFVFNDATYLAPVESDKFGGDFSVLIQSNGDQMVVDSIGASDRAQVYDNTTSVPLVVSSDRVFALGSANVISDFNHDPNTIDRFIYLIAKFMGQGIKYQSYEHDDDLEAKQNNVPSDLEKIQSDDEKEPDMDKEVAASDVDMTKMPKDFKEEAYVNHLEGLPQKWTAKYEKLASKYELDQGSDKVFAETFKKELESQSLDIKDENADFKPQFKAAWKAAAHYTKSMPDPTEMPTMDMDEMPESLKKLMEKTEPEKLEQMTEEEFQKQLEELQMSTESILGSKSQEQLENIETVKEGEEKKE